MIHFHRQQWFYSINIFLKEKTYNSKRRFHGRTDTGRRGTTVRRIFLQQMYHSVL